MATDNGLDVAFAGQPFVQMGPVSGATLDYAFGGQPFAVATTYTPAVVTPPVVTARRRLQQFIVL